MTITRREAIALGVGSTLLAPGAVRAWAAQGSGSPLGSPRICGVDNPLALGSRAPHFSWLLDDGTSARQTAYRITVAANEGDLLVGRNLLWDSGRTASARNFGIAYGGPALPERGSAIWRVEVWTKGARAPLRSVPARWETGIGDPAEWQAQWIAAETATARLDRQAGVHWITGSTNPKPGRSRFFRATIDGGAGGEAELLLSAHQTIGVWFNGQPVAADQIWPVTWTAMARYPIVLRPGPNLIAVEVKRIDGFGQAPPVLAATLRHGPGLQNRTTAQTGWKVSVDAAPGWNGTTFDDGGWEAAVAASRTLPIGEPWPNYPANQLCRDFPVGKAVRSARLYASALGVYDAEINGRAVDTRKLAPEFTDPSKRILYQAYDVTALVTAGSNRLGFWVGNGWYGGKYSTSGRFSFGSAPCRLIAQLEIDYADGTREVIGTGDGWKIAESAVRADSLYDGEVHDARLDRRDWSRPGGGEGWRAAEVVAAPDTPVEPQNCPPIRPHETIDPVAVRRLANGHHLFDFGQNLAGWPRLTLRAPAGTRIDMRFAESLKATGEIDQANLRTGQQHDVYFAAGSGRETWEPRFTYHGFRYVEVSGLPDSEADWSLQALVGYQDLDLTGEFRVGDPVIQKFWQNSLWSQKSNFWGLPTDCPQRDERLGWIGDAQVFWGAAAYNMDVGAYTARVMDDMRRSQRDNGAFPDCIPPFVPGTGLSSPGWADGGIILPHTAWRQYGDTGIIAANWDAMERYLAWIFANNPNHLWEKGRGADYGDWLAVDSSPTNPGLATTPKALIGTAFWAHNATMMAEMAEAIGKPEAAAQYRALFASLRAAFNTAYVKADGAIGNGSQTSYILPIRFGLLTREATIEAGRRLVADIEKRGGHLSTGFLGTPHILDALAATGQEATAMTLLRQRSFPSWGYMVEKGATSMWERWDSDKADGGMNSLNHYAFGAIGSFLFRRVAGIAATKPGFAEVEIAPIIDRQLGSAGATYHSASGTIRTDWRVTGDSYRLDVELPAGIAGTARLPGGKAVAVKPGPNRFSGRLG